MTTKMRTNWRALADRLAALDPGRDLVLAINYGGITGGPLTAQATLHAGAWGDNTPYPHEKLRRTRREVWLNVYEDARGVVVREGEPSPEMVALLADAAGDWAKLTLVLTADGRAYLPQAVATADGYGETYRVRS
jgi:hypothetical protein